MGVIGFEPVSAVFFFSMPCILFNERPVESLSAVFISISMFFFFDTILRVGEGGDRV